MHVTKRVIDTIPKCYCLAPLRWRGTNYFLAAAEKIGPCRLYGLDGSFQEELWQGPGGVMSICQVPGSDGRFLATNRFYSPNESKEASIVHIMPTDSGWQVNKLVNLPHVHRFDILERGDSRYLLACTLKSGHQYVDDWSSPGKVYAAVLPDDLLQFDDDRQLRLEVIKETMGHNHGYTRTFVDDIPASVVSSDSGVFRFVPPAKHGEAWEIERLVDVPTSDAVLVDLDGDGCDELVSFSPFHGDMLSVYKLIGSTYERIWEANNMEFLHSLYGGHLLGSPAFVFGYRRGEQSLMVLRYCEGSYRLDVIDSNCGSANILHYQYAGKDVIISANRETDELAYYMFS